MKNLFFIFLFISLNGFGQAVSNNITSANYSNIKTDTRSWLMKTPLDSMDAVAVDDTFYFYFPHSFATAFVGVVDINMDAVGGVSDLVGSYTVETAQCLACPWKSEATVAIPALSVYTRLAFEVRNIKMRITIIGTAGVGAIQSWITLKPSSITKT